MDSLRKIAFASARLLPWAMVTALTYPAFAGNITNLPALGANDLVAWNLGPALGSSGASPFTALSIAGEMVTISEPGSTFVNFTQSPPGGWFGHFPAGTSLIYTQDPSGPVTFAFSAPIQGFGLSIDDALGGGYDGTISEYNGTTLLGSYTSTNLSAGLMFLGVLDASSDITSVTISASPGNSFAFGDLSLVEGTSPSGVPSRRPPPPFLRASAFSPLPVNCVRQVDAAD